MADKVLVFEIGGYRYGLDASRIAMIERLPAITRVPALPAHVAGVASLRGGVEPVVDLCKLWRIPHDGEYGCALLIRHARGTVALMADTALALADLDGATARPDDPSDGFRGCVVAALPDQTAVLDANKLMDAIFAPVEG